MVITIIQLVLSLAAILGAAVLFTNVVEILGERLNLAGDRSGAYSRLWEPPCRRP